MFSVIKKYLFLNVILLLAWQNLFAQKPVIVMINPAGHAKNAGRKMLFGEYERTVAYDFAEKLQQALVRAYGVKVVLSRFVGEEIVDPLQNASFANRLGVDFYLSLHFYGEESVKPKIFLYNLVYDPVVDFIKRSSYLPVFIPIHQAHFGNIFKSRDFGKIIKEVLTLPEHQRFADCYGPFGIPIRPLCGILAPSVAIEIGLHQESAIKTLIDPIVKSLNFLKEIKHE
jgi:hypothetical protein